MLPSALPAFSAPKGVRVLPSAAACSALAARAIGAAAANRVKHKAFRVN
jgi:hypothetical protein